MTNATAAERPPVSIITGYLGSGKTTLLNRLLRDPAMAGAAVIINELGEVGLDHLLVAAPGENTVLLQNGCLCCTIRGDLVETLADLLAKRDAGGIPAFDRVLVETTGLADPVPILRTLASEGIITPRLRAGAVITVVDGVNGEVQLDSCPESVKQAAVADCLLVSKTDLADPDELARLRERLLRINPGAQRHDAVRGEIAPALLFEAVLDDSSAQREQVERWLNEAAFVKAGRAAHPGRRKRGASRHGDSIRAFAVRREGAVTRSGLAAWLDLLAALKGANLLRVKALVNVEGRPVAVHAVQSVIHEPVELASWPSAERCSRIVFITRDMARAELEATLSALELDARRAEGDTAIDPAAYARFVQAAAAFRAGK
ncbi:MAG: GTP-binding protein [Betaproteobacteria bacterium]|nr:GTP-binding protein [Betaproteobacteria bacterium]